MTEERFQEAQDEFAKLVSSKKLSDEETLLGYGWYKQATVGDNETDQPAVYNFKSRSKWNAWNEHKGKSKEEAKQEYINLVFDVLKPKYDP